MFDLGPVLGVQVAENSQKAGTGRILAAVTSVEEHDGIANNILWTQQPQMFDATLRRFPDLLQRPGWAEFANELPNDRLVVQELALQLRRHSADGGAVAMWDAPSTLARLGKYGFTAPPRIIDLKVFNRLLLPTVRGKRTPETMALAYRVQVEGDLMNGLEREAQTLQHLGHLVRSLVAQRQVPVYAANDWDELHYLQVVAAAEQSAGLRRWLRSRQGGHGKLAGDVELRTGWPVWD